MPEKPAAPDAAIEDSLYEPTHREPMSEEERQEMLSVLDNDAQEVEDVVHEIRDRLSEMETQITLLSTHASRAKKAHKGLKNVLSLLRKAGDEMPGHITAAKTFRSTWAHLREEITSKTEEVVSLAGFYESFSASYASLLREVERRRMVEGKMKKVADRARKEIQALYREDVDMREQFVREVGEFLPRDIWPGLIDAPRKWEIRDVSAEERLLLEEEQG